MSWQILMEIFWLFPRAKKSSFLVVQLFEKKFPRLPDFDYFLQKHQFSLKTLILFLFLSSPLFLA